MVFIIAVRKQTRTLRFSGRAYLKGMRGQMIKEATQQTCLVSTRRYMGVHTCAHLYTHMHTSHNMCIPTTHTNTPHKRKHTLVFFLTKFILPPPLDRICSNTRQDNVIQTTQTNQLKILLKTGNSPGLAGSRISWNSLALPMPSFCYLRYPSHRTCSWQARQQQPVLAWNRV